MFGSSEEDMSEASFQRAKSLHARLLRALLGAAGMLCIALLLPPGAEAQVALDQFKPAPLASDGFALSRPEVLAPKGFSFMAVVDYANEPLIFTRDRPKQETKVVEHQLVLNLGVAFALGKRVTAFALIPMNLMMDGDNDGAQDVNVPPADGAGLGDVALGGRLLMFDAKYFSLGGELIARLPTAELADDKQSYAGDQVGSYEGALIGELHFSHVDLRARVGLRFRKEEAIADLKLGHELLYGYGMRILLVRDFYLHAELYGASNFAAFKKVEVTPFELLGGPKYQKNGWFFGAAAGAGLLEGYGSPQFRVLGLLGYERKPERPAPPQAPRDTDGDGLLDVSDRCPNDPEDRDSFADDDGCPDPDNDGDGLLDGQDGCPNEAEDKDGFEDANGCPDPDNDGDGVLDASDRCPSEAEDKDGFEDEDGCPDPDNDKDGVLDGADACPLEPGTVEEKGCPRVRVEKGQIRILERVEFATNKDTILPQSDGILSEVTTVLQNKPEIARVRVEGHTDSRGRAVKNLDLSKRRARSVARWLVQHGIGAARLEAYGCGAERPIESNDTDQGRQTNRRVEFHILEPAPETPPSTQGCESIPVE
jgi:outer membrane protein OmpA-like peptidoglycan-associated protein